MAPSDRSCGTGAPVRGIALPVLPAGIARMRRSRNGPRRAAVLIGVHVVMAIHILLWVHYGMTLSPVEPSESMYTLEKGELNAGFVFFALAIVSTLLFGRFFCGWGCHVVALQDLCAWVMRRMRVHPKPFRTRLLVLAPLALALYMFVWPTFRREVLAPALRWISLDVPAWMGEVGRRPELHAAFVVEDFWATFPAWYVAVPFLAVCGFAAVYFLGSKGFCTYGCPYGGFFAPADQVAVGRILVNDDCEHCGHCTATCTSNVRVHEEVRDYGMVVDPGCMKCMDCVSVCPNHALRFGFAPPPVLNRRARAGKRSARPRRNFDLSVREEAWVALVGLVLFFGFRGLLNQVPMLMAMGLAGIGAFGAWKLVSLVRVPHVRLQSLQLRYRGRLTRSGLVFAAAAVAFLGIGAWGAVVNYHVWRGRLLDRRVDIPAEVYLTPGFRAAPPLRLDVEAAIRHLERAGPPGEGGVGWTRSPDINLRLGSLHAISGRFERAEAYLLRAMEQERPTQQFLAFAQRVAERRAGSPDGPARFLERVVELYPDHAGAHGALASALAAGAQLERAVVPAREALKLGLREPEQLGVIARILAAAGDTKGAVDAAARAADAFPQSGEAVAQLALALIADGETERGLATLERACSLEPRNAPLRRLQAEILNSLGRREEAAAALRLAEELARDRR